MNSLPVPAAIVTDGKPRLWARSGSILAVLVAACVMAGPFYLPPYGLVVGFGLFIAVAMAEAWNLVGGVAGQFALGHSMFVGVGSYVTALILINTDLPMPVAIAASGIVAGLIAALSALLFLRMRAAYFSVATLGLSLAGLAWTITWPYAGATAGLNLPGDAGLDDDVLYYLAGGLAILTIAGAALLLRRPFGISLMAVRDDEEAAAEMGVNPLVAKTVIMALSGLLTGLAGALVAVEKQTIEPYSAFSMVWAINMIVMSVIGGLGRAGGPALGAVFVFGLQQLLQSYAMWNQLVTAAALILVIRFAPGGIWSILATMLARLASAKAGVGMGAAPCAEDLSPATISETRGPGGNHG